MSTLIKYQRPRTSSKTTKKHSTILCSGKELHRPKNRNPTQLPGEEIPAKWISEKVLL